MPYELIVDGAVQDLGDKRYLLSPQDLSAVNEIPALIGHGINSFKIEGRLKSPEYVAAVCQVYRKAIDAALENREGAITAEDRYKMEMTFSRGLYSGWMHGVNHQELVSARYGKKRGPFVGRIARVGRDFVELDPLVPVKPGDGVVFDTSGDTNSEQGGRIWQVRGTRLFFEHDSIDFSKIKANDRIWKTDDPALNSQLRKSFAGKIEPRHRERIDLRVTGRVGEPLAVEAGVISVRSAIPLQEARTAPLTTERLQEHLGRFGESIYALGNFENAIEGAVILPIGELNRLRRELVYRLDEARKVKREESARPVCEILETLVSIPAESLEEASSLSILCRTMEQVEAALDCDAKTVYADFEDIRRYKEAVEFIRRKPGAEILLATPRIQKAGEQGFFKLIESYAPDGVLIRNLGAIEYFAGKPLKQTGDFSLNVANPLTAAYLRQKGLERVTISYDLDIDQVLALIRNAPPEWFELTIHQHMPMFHMEHCVFAAFMSKGTTFLDCGRPCEKHRVHLRDRVGIEHPLRADVGCRNTLFNAAAQTGARFFRDLQAAGLRSYRIELLEETAEQSRTVIRAYQSLLAGERDGENLWRQLKAQSQLGVTHGTYQPA